MVWTSPQGTQMDAWDEHRTHCADGCNDTPTSTYGPDDELRKLAVDEWRYARPLSWTVRSASRINAATNLSLGDNDTNDGNLSGLCGDATVEVLCSRCDRLSGLGGCDDDDGDVSTWSGCCLVLVLGDAPPAARIFWLSVAMRYEALLLRGSVHRGPRTVDLCDLAIEVASQGARWRKGSKRPKRAKDRCVHHQSTAAAPSPVAPTHTNDDDGKQDARMDRRAEVAD